MNIARNLSKHMHNVYYGGNWCVSNYQEVLRDITWQQATTRIQDLNTIATLVFHTSYYVSGICELLEGKPLTIKDKYSFDHPPIHSKEDWKNLLEKVFNEADRFIALIAKMPEDKMAEDFSDPKYGSYYANLTGILEHLHYHLGQIVLIKKLLNTPK